jgi:phosphoesterase RecJ-like protein
MNSIDEIKSILDAYGPRDTVAVCAHVNPDGDAIGSNLAIAAYMRSRGCEVISLLAQDAAAPAAYRFLDATNAMIPASQYASIPDLFIAVDTPNAQRLGSGADVCARAKRSVAIDHHPNYDGFANAYYGNEHAPACASIIWELTHDAAAVCPDIATYCYMGLITDTGRFAYSSTTARTLRDAAAMVDAGASPSELYKAIYENKSLGMLRLEALVVRHMRFLEDGAVVSSWISKDDFKATGTNRADTERLPATLCSVAGVHVAVLLREEDDEAGGIRVRASLRSNDGSDISVLAGRHDGGGHPAASGATLHMTLDDAIKTFPQELADYWKGISEV